MLTVFNAQAQEYRPDDGYDDYGGYYYDDPYSPYPPPPPYYEPTPRYQEPSRERRRRATPSARGMIVIATREHTLVYTTAWGEQFAYPIAVGREKQTMVRVDAGCIKREHPEWRPTASMRQKNPRLPTVVGPGPSKPLGTRAIYLADGLLRIHGTNDPSSIGTKRVERLLSDVSRRRRGALRDGAAGDSGDRPAIVEFRLTELSGTRPCLRRCHAWQASANSDIVFKDRNVSGRGRVAFRTPPVEFEDFLPGVALGAQVYDPRDRAPIVWRNLQLIAW